MKILSQNHYCADQTAAGIYPVSLARGSQKKKVQQWNSITTAFVSFLAIIADENKTLNVLSVFNRVKKKVIAKVIILFILKFVTSRQYYCRMPQGVISFKTLITFQGSNTKDVGIHLVVI